MIDVNRLSRRYRVRVLDVSDLEDIFELCQGNTLFYRYCEAQPTREQILSDMRITPPGVDHRDKYYIGFYQDGDLVAVMDLIDGYPAPEIAFIGFFMVDVRYQGKQVGTAIISELAACLRADGKTALRLAIDKGNPQSTHFWQKNGFRVLSEVERDGWTALVAERTL